MSQARTNQGGSVVSFVVVGVVLVALVIGGVYMLQHRGGGDTPDVAKTNSPAPAPSASSSSSPVPSTSKSPAPLKSAQPTPPSSSPKSTPSTAPVPENMPATGPSDLLPSGIMIAVLLGMAVSYAQSRSARKRALQHQ